MDSADVDFQVAKLAICVPNQVLLLSLEDLRAAHPKPKQKSPQVPHH
jgi:hypothetical protein